MFKKSLIALCLLSVVLFVACSDDDDNPVSPQRVTGSGDLITEARSLSDFHSVSLLTVGTVRLTSGAQQAVSVTVDDNVMEYIVTTVVNNELIISSDPSVSLSNFDLTLNLTMTDLESLTLTGVGSFAGLSPFSADSVDLVLAGVGSITLDIESDYLSSSLVGVGSFSLSGAVDRHDCVHASVGSVNAFPLISDTTVAVLSGTGSAEVFVNDSLDVIISGAGSLLYKGQPAINVSITGTGTVVDAN